MCAHSHTYTIPHVAINFYMDNRHTSCEVTVQPPPLPFADFICIKISQTYENVMELFGMGEGPHFAQVCEDDRLKT